MRLGIVVLIASALCSCKSNDGTGAGGPDASRIAGRCRSDADCPSRSCGPCTPGEIVRADTDRTSCYRNPCTNSRSICNPRGQCAVHPDTKFIDDVHSDECKRLLHDKWAVLCKDKVGSALTECEDIVDAATARDDDTGCNAARARATSPTGQNTFGSLFQIALGLHWSGQVPRRGQGRIGGRATPVLPCTVHLKGEEG